MTYNLIPGLYGLIICLNVAVQIYGWFAWWICSL